MGLRTGVDDVKKIKILLLLVLELGSFVRPASSHSLCRLSYNVDCNGIGCNGVEWISMA